MCKVNDNVLNYNINNNNDCNYKYEYNCEYKINNTICKDNLKCKYCNSSRVNKRDKQKYNGKQRYLCRDCGKIWTEGIDGRIKYSEEKRKRVFDLYLENVAIRSIERLENISAPLIIKLIKKMGKNIKNKMNEAIDKIKEDINNLNEENITKENIPILEIDEMVTSVKKNLKILKQKKETLPSYGLRLIGSDIKLLDLKSEIEQ